MILEAERQDCVREVLVLAAALSIRDPRERPEEHIDLANAAHKRFDVPGSDLLSILALWDHLRTQQRALSGNQFRRLCRTEYLNYLRVREWQRPLQPAAPGRRRPRDPPAQGAAPSRTASTSAVLAGLLSHIGMRDDDGRELQGARGSTFTIARGSVLARKPPRWVMAAELVETNRLWARPRGDDRAGLGRAARRAPRAALVRRAALGRAPRRRR